MRVLWITNSFYPQIGGLQVYVDRLTNSLSKLSDVGLVTASHQSAPENPSISHFRVEKLTRPGKAEVWQQAAADVRKVIADFRPDVVHFSCATVAVYRATIPCGVPVLATVHGNDLTWPSQFIPGEDPTAWIVDGLNACDHVLAVSNHTAALLRRWGVTAPQSVFTAGCDLDFFQPNSDGVAETRLRYGITVQAPMLLTVARLVSRKGHFHVLEALGRLPFPVWWMVVGNGPLLGALSESVTDLGLEDQVRMVGEISNQDLLALYNACDIFVLVSEEREDGRSLDSEGFGLVFHEAGACGKPVIATDISGCKEAVVDGVTGLLVPPADPQALADRIEYLFSNPEVADALGRGGLALVRTLGGWDRLAFQVHEMYERLAAERVALGSVADQRK
jgi:phosphatidylinositol alpha-1,6-mannosyltransferase